MKNAELHYLAGLFQRGKDLVSKLNYFVRICNSIFEHGKKMFESFSTVIYNVLRINGNFNFKRRDNQLQKCEI